MGYLEMIRTAALAYLAECVTSAIMENGCDVTIFTGSRDGRPCRDHARRLAAALRALDREDAARTVEAQAGLI